MAYMAIDEPRFHIEFIKACNFFNLSGRGHPTKYEVYGPPRRVICSSFQAENLVYAGFAKLLPKEGRGDHFCPDLDEMLICREDPEWELCNCENKERNQ
jgi:hypothetical protein